MVCLIQSRTEKVVHRRIDNDKALVVAVLDINHAGQKRAAIGDDRPSRLESQLETAIGENSADKLAIGGEIGRGPSLVIDADSAAKVESRHRQPLAAKRAAKIKKRRIGALERIEVKNLRADMNRQSGRPDMRIVGKLSIQGGGLVLGSGDTEFGGTLAGRDFRMRVRGDIDIDPQRHWRRDPARRRDTADGLDLGRAFGVDLADAGIQRGANFRGGFADSRKDDLCGRHAGGKRALQLTARDNVGTGPLAGQQRDHAKRRIGLQREMHLAVNRRHRGGKIAVIGADTIARIDIERRAVRCRDILQRQAANDQTPVIITRKAVCHARKSPLTSGDAVGGLRRNLGRAVGIATFTAGGQPAGDKCQHQHCKSETLHRHFLSRSALIQPVACPCLGNPRAHLIGRCATETAPHRDGCLA